MLDHPNNVLFDSEYIPTLSIPKDRLFQVREHQTKNKRHIPGIPNCRGSGELLCCL
jgi:hypothetical protein